MGHDTGLTREAVEARARLDSGPARAKRKLVLVGNGMAGMRAIEELLELAPDLYDITVFGAEPHGNYNRILLSPVLASEKTIADIMLNTREWYDERRIRLIAGDEVVKIDRARRRVIAASGVEAPYDRLILATGSNPVVLPLPGKELPGVVTYRDIADVDKMISAARDFKHAIVIGGGLLGLEAAYGLQKRGMKVTVVHLLPTLMERQLDPAAGDLLRRSLEERGLEFRMPAQTKEIVGDERVRAVRFGDGTELPADLVVMAVGIRPNAALAKASGLACERGVLVSDTMQTFDPRIYALGECVQHRGACYGLVAPLFEQAKVLANHLAEFGIGRYAGSQTSTKLKVTGIDLFSAGDFSGGADTEELVFKDAARGVYKKIVVKDDKIRGAVLYGDTVDGAWYFQLLREGTPIADFRESLLFGQAHLGDSGLAGAAGVTALPDNAEICGCNGVCKGDIVKAITAKSLFTLDDVRAHTKASSSCGSCTGLVEQLLANTLGGDYSETPAKKPMCPCTIHTHEEVRQTIVREKLKSIPRAMEFLEWKTPDGCHKCRPALNFYLLCAWPGEYEDDKQSRFINERAHGNIQRDGTYSVVPRIWGGVTSAKELRAIADVAEKYAVPTVKVTGGQRIDLLGEEERPAADVEGSERGRLRLGSRVRQGAADREDLRRQRVVPVRHSGLDRPRHQARAHDLGLMASAQGEARGIRLPTQLRGGDDQGPRRRLRRLWVRAARRRQRRHQGSSDGFPLQGRNGGRRDRALLRVLAALSRGGAVSRAHGAVDRTRRALARARQDRRRRRGQASALLALPRGAEVLASRSLGRTRARQGRGRIRAARGAHMSWLDVGPLDGLPPRGARVVRVGVIDIAVFRTGEGQVFALRDQCPHRGGPLSQGIVHGYRVTCPLHEWVIDLRSGSAVGADTGCTPAFATRVVDGRVAIDVPGA